MSFGNRTVRCLLVGEDLDLPTACFSLPIDEDHTTVQELQTQVLERLPEEQRGRLGAGVQLFKGFDLYVDHSQRVPSHAAVTATAADAPETAPSSAFETPQKPSRRQQRRSLSPTDATIAALLHQATSTPENKVAGRYFQRKYAMRQRDAVAPYLARGRKCASSRIDVLVSAPKVQFSGDIAAMEQKDQAEELLQQQQEDEVLVDRRDSIDYANSDTGSFDYSSPTDISFFDDNDTVVLTTPTKPPRRDPVVMDAMRNSSSPLMTMQTPSKWQRAPCGRVVSVATLRLRSPCTRCCAMH
ncbi:hypothetical protein PINS_up009881 [Pythium insidiosum]|nr:hypothetical protein PINS_up009881 [Pythium insidiosum]